MKTPMFILMHDPQQHKKHRYLYQ